LLSTLTGPVPPFQLVAMAFTVATLVAIAIARLRRPARRLPLRLPVGAWALGVGGLFGYHFFYFLALRTAPPVAANLLNYLWPLLIVLFVAVLPGQRFQVRHLAGALLGAAGAAILITGGRAGGLDAHHLGGYAAAVACAVIWAAYSVANRRYREVPSEAVGGFCAVTALLAAVCHGLFETTAWPQGWQWAALLLLGLGPVGAAFFVWDAACKHGDLRTLGTLAYAVPLLSNGLLLAAGQGRLSWSLAVAALMIVGGAALGAGDLIRRGGSPDPGRSQPPA
jgi:drug/metabolite transporter (DMT)-like permease